MNTTGIYSSYLQGSPSPSSGNLGCNDTCLVWGLQGATAQPLPGPCEGQRRRGKQRREGPVIRSAAFWWPSDESVLDGGDDRGIGFAVEVFWTICASSFILLHISWPQSSPYFWVEPYSGVVVEVCFLLTCSVGAWDTPEIVRKELYYSSYHIFSQVAMFHSTLML